MLQLYTYTCSEQNVRYNNALVRERDSQSLLQVAPRMLMWYRVPVPIEEKEIQLKRRWEREREAR